MRSLIARTSLLLAAPFMLSVLAPAAEFPGEHWSTVTPAEAGLDEAKLKEARDYALSGGGSGCIIRGGKLVFSWGDQALRYDLKSSTKSFGAAALGLAIADGKMQLTDKARAHHPTFGTPPESNAATGWLDEITLLHLAAQTAGFDKPGGFAPLLFRPGTEWAYSDSGPNWLAECITLACRRDVDELMFERIFTPLGIRRTDLVWRKHSYRPDLLDGIKRREFGAGISANVDAMARFGLLWLRGGEWNGTPILPRAFVDRVRTTVSGVPGLKVHAPEHYGRASSHYGLLWWNNADETIEGLPLDTYWTRGLYDSLIVVMPSLDLVVARAGQSWKRAERADHYEVGFARVTGTPPDLRGENIRSESGEALGDGQHGRKASGLLCLDGVLFLLVRNAGNSQLGWSSDHGATWQWADWKFTESFGCPTFLNFGRNNAGARDSFVYLYSHDSGSAYERADRFVLARVPAAHLRERAAYEFFTGLDPAGQPQWSTDIAQRGAVFTHPGACYRSSISYHPGLRRYLWCRIGPGNDTRYSGGFSIYDAPAPWGPWTTAFHTAAWDVGPGESSSLPTKWMSPDNRTLHLVFSGDDHFSVRQGTIILREKPSAP